MKILSNMDTGQKTACKVGELYLIYTILRADFVLEMGRNNGIPRKENLKIAQRHGKINYTFVTYKNAVSGGIENGRIGRSQKSLECIENNITS